MLQTKHLLSPDFALVFRALPGLYLLLSPDLVILDATERYAQTSNFAIGDVVGKHILDTFPDNPDESNSLAKQDLEASLRHVLQHKEAHTMPVLRFDVPLAQGGGFRKMFWRTVNIPLLNSEGEIVYILHETQDITSHMLQERISQQNSQWIDMLSDSLHAVAWEYDILGDDLIWGKGLQELFGYTPEEMVGDAWDKCVHPDDLKAVRQSMADALAAGEKFWTGEYRLKKANGTYAHVLDQSYIVYNEQGKAIRTFGSMIDISESKRLKKDLQESDARFRHLLENLPHMASTADADGKTLYFNDNWYSYTGMKPGQTDGWVHVVHPDDSSDALISWHEAAREGHSHEMELRIRNAADGAYRTFLRRSVPMFDVAGKVKLWICTYTDIEDQRQSLKRVWPKDQQLKKILELSPVQLCLLEGPEHICSYVTPGIYHLYGNRNYLGHPAHEIWPELLPLGFNDLLDQVYQQGDTVQINEFMTKVDPIGGDGKAHEAYFNFKYQPFAENGSTTGILISALEVTELVEAKKKAEQLANELRQR
ncbi:PAS domain-containing protein [Pontibacter sp. E15-1]|uniref:PAS domain-containing protein n=1 Tax=Pontibacter sp. E15-1 TaxID=2919918 RepID=UPI001F4FBBF1|nr:PAS domain-containing protein [Pontibacter sp. E15-1]MCJ8165496.1 PAS domain-containing protein [Pontibacter sp. E15-1]